MGARILIAEDDESIVASLEFLMRRSGHEARHVNDGMAALDAVLEFRPHLVILDLMLPRRSGLDVCREIRARSECDDVRVLMLTAKGGAQEVARGLAAGADAYMIKPFSTHELVERVAALLAPRVPGAATPGPSA